MRLRRELLTRAVHTESRRLILWRACKGRNIKSLFSHAVLIHTSYQGLLHRTSLALWDCWTSQDKSKSFPTFVVIIYHFATFFVRGGQSLASVFALIRSEVVDGCSGRSRWPTKKMRSSSQLIIFVMHKNCAFHSLAAFFLSPPLFWAQSETQQRNKMYESFAAINLASHAYPPAHCVR